ncbi:MAG: hypothetical protein ACTXOO_00785 [Sodalis sp. (in: enterobacteria)]
MKHLIARNSATPHYRRYGKAKKHACLDWGLPCWIAACLSVKARSWLIFMMTPGNVSKGIIFAWKNQRRPSATKDFDSLPHNMASRYLR